MLLILIEIYFGIFFCLVPVFLGFFQDEVFSFLFLEKAVKWQKAAEREVLTLHSRDGLQRNVQLKQTFPWDEEEAGFVPCSSNEPKAACYQLGT